MPAILVKDYTWRQTPEYVILHVPLVGHPKNVDSFAIDNYVKVSFAPFILELFLWGNIDEENSKCTLTDEEAIFSLQKTQIGPIWPHLELENIDGELKREYRNRALERARVLAEERAKVKSEKRQYLQKEAVKAQIDIDTATLNKIEATRDAHRKEAMLELDDWRSKAALPFLDEIEGTMEENRKPYRPPLKWFNDDDGKVKSRPLTDEEIFNGNPSGPAAGGSQKSGAAKVSESKVSEVKSTGDTSGIDSPANGGEILSKIESGEEYKPVADFEKEEMRKEAKLSRIAITRDETSCSEDSEDSESDSEIKHRDKTRSCREPTTKPRSGKDLIEEAMTKKLVKRSSIFEDPAKSVPLPRRSGTIDVTFSPRVFPTPARESARLEEEQWLAKQAEARRKTGFVAEDLRPEERDPQWLKDKGDDFFKVGNYLGAISAYSHAIKISDKMASLYANRSAAHYALENYCKCIEDCSMALTLMEPKCEGNRESRARCHARRGAALCKLSAPQHGIPELEAAVKLAPDNDSIRRDIQAAKQYFDTKG